MTTRIARTQTSRVSAGDSSSDDASSSGDERPRAAAQSVDATLAKVEEILVEHENWPRAGARRVVVAMRPMAIAQNLSIWAIYDVVSSCREHFRKTRKSLDAIPDSEFVAYFAQLAAECANPPDVIAHPGPILAAPPYREFRRMEERDISLKEAGPKMEPGLFRCPRCGSSETFTIQKQMRSADEPMTNINTCTQCHYRWNV